MRKCWNWQTGMTKDHVRLASEGSSPFFRIKKEVDRLLFLCIKTVGLANREEGTFPYFRIKKEVDRLLFFIVFRNASDVELRCVVLFWTVP